MQPHERWHGAVTDARSAAGPMATGSTLLIQLQHVPLQCFLYNDPGKHVHPPNHPRTRTAPAPKENLSRGTHPGMPGPHRKAESRPECLHHRDRRFGARRSRAAEAEIARGDWRGPLHGIPLALKDLIDTAAVRTTAGSKRHKDRIPTEDAEVVRRLRQAGAVIVGKNNLHEFAYGGSSLVSYFGDVHNSRDAARIAGGSSGGSATAVTARMACAAIGTDTAGSVREPAALCGCVGLKPTYGRVSRRGVIPLSASLDHVGPLAASVEDAAIVLQAIAGYDPADITSVNVPVADYVSGLKESVKSVRAGVPREYFFDDLDKEVAVAV